MHELPVGPAEGQYALFVVQLLAELRSRKRLIERDPDNDAAGDADGGCDGRQGRPAGTERQKKQAGHAECRTHRGGVGGFGTHSISPNCQGVSPVWQASSADGRWALGKVEQMALPAAWAESIRIEVREY
jgi:hypothetical protein